MMKKFLLSLFLLIIFANFVSAENCSGSMVLNTDCNIATQLIDTTNRPAETAICDANLYSPLGIPSFLQNEPQHWVSGIYLIESDLNFSSLGRWIFSITCSDGGDVYFGSKEFNIVLTEEETTTAEKCEFEISAVASKKANALIFSASGFDSKRNSLNLTPTIDIFDLDSGLKTINQETMTEQADIPGLYTYYFTGIFMPSNYGILVYLDENCSKYGEFEVEKTFFGETEQQQGLESNPTGLIGLTTVSFFPILEGFLLIGIIILSLIIYNKWIKRRFAP